MKKVIKSQYLSKKYQKSQNHDFYLFAYFSTSKAEVDSDLNRTYKKNHLKRLILPSFFKVVHDQNVQGPRIGIVYSSSLNFEQLPIFYNLRASCFKLKNNWYSYDLLCDLKDYKSSYNLCICANASLKRNLGQFFLFLKIAI